MAITHSSLSHSCFNDQTQTCNTNARFKKHQTCTHKTQGGFKDLDPRCTQLRFRTRLLKKHQINKTIRVFFRLSRRSSPKTKAN